MLPPLSLKEKSDLWEAQLLPWMADPFKKHDHSKHHHDQPIEYTRAPGGKEPSTGENTIERQEALDEHEEIEEATPIELFYDLFFVANLTTVTGVHYITEWRTLSSYILFFIILWFTWLHVTLLDVRFSVDSVYERICKALHFAVMAAFSSVSTTWDPFSPDTVESVRALRTMTLTLMFSRFIIAIQYFVVLIFGIRKKKNTVLPLALHSLSMIVSACVYLGLYWSFREGQHRKSYFAWYIMAIFEVIAVVGATSNCKTINFKKTHLVERMGLLTLIILGEGIIVMLKAINAIVRGFGWTKSTFGVVAAALFIIYLFWMFYFDYTPKNVHYGTIRQQIWALLHFPYHLAVVLAVEGLRQFATMQSFTLMVREVNKMVESIEIGDPAILPEYFRNLIQTIYEDGGSKFVLKKYSTIMTTIGSLQNATEGSQQYLDYLSKVQVEVFTGLGEFYGIKAPDIKSDNDDDKLEAIIGVFDLVFQYFYIAMGVIFLMYGIFAIIVRRSMDIFDYISIGLRFAVSLAFFAMLDLRYNTRHDNAYGDFMWGSWPIPQACLMVFFVLIVDKTMAYFAFRRASKRVALQGGNHHPQM